jgi:hypothetical protein
MAREPHPDRPAHLRFRRGLLGALLALSVVFTVSMTAFIVTTLFRRATLTGKPFNASWQVAAGAFSVEWLVRSPNGSQSGFGNPGFVYVPTDAVRFCVLPRYGSSGTYRVLVIPLWPLVAVGGASSWWAGRKRRRIALTGRCPGCGYPRDGLPAKQPCPECGRASLWARLHNLLRSTQHPSLPALPA